MTRAPVKPYRRWLITGGSGRVGRMVLRHWQHQSPPAELLIQYRGTATGGPLPGPASVRHVHWDPLSGDVPDFGGAVDCLIALAGITPATPAALEVNTALARATLKVAKRQGIRRVLLTSSSAVYGASESGAPLREDTPLRPLNPYGAAKQEMEIACAPWRDAGIDVCCLRIGNVAGADALLLNAVTAPQDQPLCIDEFADGGGPIRSYVGPATLATILESLAVHPDHLPPVLNIAAPRPIRMEDLAQAAGLPWIGRPAPPTAVHRVTLDVTALSHLHCFAPADSSAAEMVRQWQVVKDPA